MNFPFALYLLPCPSIIRYCIFFIQLIQCTTRVYTMLCVFAFVLPPKFIYITNPNLNFKNNLCQSVLRVPGVSRELNTNRCASISSPLCSRRVPLHLLEQSSQAEDLLEIMYSKTYNYSLILCPDGESSS
ncbi:hypothetical protein CPB84DRAFT_1478858 [Gymnopilus junonius]|uniref:Uncharacterized protein n=1 Tax=Gymnopilus junonius TaxID=109634 RepID=A0A9P5TKN8_GYMJU|nr:hypothetical protein CPB84DRAFT_1478858 [Gymnopilus junonius]